MIIFPNDFNNESMKIELIVVQVDTSAPGSSGGNPIGGYYGTYDLANSTDYMRIKNNYTIVTVIPVGLNKSNHLYTNAVAYLTGKEGLIATSAIAGTFNVRLFIFYRE